MPRLSFLVPCRSGDPRLPRLADLLARQGFAPGDHEIVTVAHGAGRSRGEALDEAIRQARAPFAWVLDAQDIPYVGAGAALVQRLQQDRLDALCFRIRRLEAVRVHPVRFEMPAKLPAAPVMPGPACISRHNVEGPLASAVFRTELLRLHAGRPLADAGPAAEWPKTFAWIHAAGRVAHLPISPLAKVRSRRPPPIEPTVQAALRLREMVDELKTAGNPSQNLALRLLRRSELVALDLLWDLARTGSSLNELRAVRRRLREAEVLPVRHLAGAEATPLVRLRSLGARWPQLAYWGARAGL